LHTSAERAKTRGAMRTYLECVACAARQAVEAARSLELADEAASRLLRRVLALLLEVDWRVPPPVIGRDIHRVIRDELNSPDPYLEQKLAATDQALRLLPEAERHIAQAQDSFYEAVRLSVAGNVIDLGAVGGKDILVREVLDQALTAALDREEMDEFERAARAARSILFLADNAGEIVLDRPLLEALGRSRVTVAVRGSPTINDATVDDARRSGVTKRFRVIDNGSDTPGTWLPECSAEFVRQFEAADLIVAKGQGNYETLSDCSREIVFLLRVKCWAVGADLQVPVGTFVARHKPGSAALGARVT
jgi:uncharacterized protein with ATP-grasp and redox domains